MSAAAVQRADFDAPAIDGAAIWAAIRARLPQEFGQAIFDSWLKPIEFVRLDSGQAVLSLSTHFMCDYVRNHFLDRLRGLWSQAGIDSVVMIVSPAIRLAASVIEPLMQSQEPCDLDPRYGFDGFVIGKANELAYNAARALAEGGRVAFNPLFLHGQTGLGKTHLMNAIGWEVKTRNPAAKVAYMSAEKFMVDFLGALRAKDTIGFKQRLRSVDLLMIDDVQFIAGKESTQEEFFHTMNELISAGKRLVLAADRSPQNLEGVQDRILSRMAGGLVADINPADYELRLNILIAKRDRMPGVDVPDEVLEFLARRITANVRELEGALNRVAAYASLVSKPVDIEFARATLADVLRANEKKITIDEIQRKVADYYAIKLADLLSARRAREVARPRQVAMWLAKRLTPRSLPEIGRRFGGRDHTTVMHAVKRIDELRAADRELDGDIERLTKLLDN